MSNPCQQERFLSAFLDQALPAAQMDQVRDHLQGCTTCRSKLAVLRQTDEMIRDLPPTIPSSGFDTAFWAKVAGINQVPWWQAWLDRLRVGWRPILPAGLTAGLAAGLVAAIIIYKQVPATPSPEEIFMVENIEMLSDFELLQRLDLLENWDAIQGKKERG